jgi:hypothetical protein
VRGSLFLGGKLVLSEHRIVSVVSGGGTGGLVFEVKGLVAWGPWSVEEEGRRWP